jgi:hypothetical protein
VVSDVAGVDSGSEPVRDGSNEVGDPLGLDDLEDTKRGSGRDWREGSLKIVLGRWGSRVGWDIVGSDGHVGDGYEEGNIWVGGTDGSRPAEEGGRGVAERKRGW